MARRVLIVSTSLKEQEQLTMVYSHHPNADLVFETTASFAQDSLYWTLETPAALVLVLPSDEELLRHFYEKLARDVPHTLRILFVAPTITPGLMHTSASFERVRILKSPVEPFFFYRSLMDLTTNYPPDKNQVHPRYLTDQEVEIISDLKNKKMAGKMRNLSMGGAYVEVTELVPTFAIDDLVRIEVPSRSSYRFDAKVVWSQNVRGENATGYGCTFLNSMEVYDTLLTHASR